MSTAAPGAPAAPPTPAPNAMRKLLDFVGQLDRLKAPYRLACWRDAVMVELATPGYRWEVEFFPDGSVEVERFASDGGIADEGVLPELFAALL